MAALNAGYLFAQSLIVEGLQPNARRAGDEWLKGR
jgi:hypothetical protein